MREYKLPNFYYLFAIAFAFLALAPLYNLLCFYQGKFFFINSEFAVFTWGVFFIFAGLGFWDFFFNVTFSKTRIFLSLCGTLCVFGGLLFVVFALGRNDFGLSRLFKPLLGFLSFLPFMLFPLGFFLSKFTHAKSAQWLCVAYMGIWFAEIAQRYFYLNFLPTEYFLALFNLLHLCVTFTLIVILLKGIKSTRHTRTLLDKMLLISFVFYPLLSTFGLVCMRAFYYHAPIFHHDFSQLCMRGIIYVTYIWASLGVGIFVFKPYQISSRAHFYTLCGAFVLILLFCILPNLLKSYGLNFFLPFALLAFLGYGILQAQKEIRKLSGGIKVPILSFFAGTFFGVLYMIFLLFCNIALFGSYDLLGAQHY